jgi:hypothetical protein
MSEQKSFQTVQYIPLTVAELKSASDSGNGSFETANGIKFTNVEIIGVVQRVSTKEDGGVTISVGSSFKPGTDPDIIYTFSGKFTDEAVVDAMNRTRQYSIVVLRGKFTMYIKDNEQRIGVNPHQIIEVDSEGGKDARTRELWLYNLLATRVANKFPVIIGDDVHFILTRDGIVSAPASEGMVIVNPGAVVSGGTNVPVPKPVAKPAPAANPAPKPALPQKLAAAKPVPKPVSKPSPASSPAGKDDAAIAKIIDAIAEQSGSGREAIAEEVKGMEDGGFMPALASAIECAKIHDVDVSDIVGQAIETPIKVPEEKTAPPIPKPAAAKPTPVPAKPAKAPATAIAPKPAKKPAEKTPSAKTPAAKPAGKDVASEIIGYLDQHEGTGNINDIYASLKGAGIEMNVAEAAIVDLHGKGTIIIDEMTVTKT